MCSQCLRKRYACLHNAGGTSLIPWDCVLNNQQKPALTSYHFHYMMSSHIPQRTPMTRLPLHDHAAATPQSGDMLAKPQHARSQRRPQTPGASSGCRRPPRPHTSAAPAPCACADLSTSTTKLATST